MTNETLNKNLEKALLRNSIFSLISGLILLILGGTLKTIFGLDNGLFLRIIGIVLIIFAIQLRALASNYERQEWMGWYASLNDIAWILGSIALILFKPITIPSSGIFVMGFIALVVGYFAYSQLQAIAQVVSYYELSREVDMPSEVVWPIISDVNGFQKYAAGISSTKVLLGEKKGMLRRCHDLKEQGWNETCINWIDGESYSMEVDTTDYPYPFQKFQGTWSVKSVDDTTSIITMRYDYVPRYGILGKIMMNRMFSKMAEDIINDIIDKYVIEAETLEILA